MRRQDQRCRQYHCQRQEELEDSQRKGRGCLAPLPRGRSHRGCATFPLSLPNSLPPLTPSLLPALDKYRPETSRSTRSLSRFPNRNRFISDYIYHVTGKRRTAKQVGSRLQQLRDTCGGKRSQYFCLSSLLRAHISDSLQFSSFYLTVTSRLLPRRMTRFLLPWKTHTFQMASLLAHPPRNVPSPSVDMRRSPLPAPSSISMYSRQMHLGHHQMMLVS